RRRIHQISPRAVLARERNHEIRLPQEFIEGSLLDVFDVRIVDQHPHAESFPDPGYFPADGAVADHAKRAAAQFPSHRRLRYPARAVVHARAGDAARQVHHESKHHLGHRRDEAGARLRDEHARFARRGNVDVADVDRAAHERHQVRQALEYLGWPWRLPVGDYDLAVFSGTDQLLALKRFFSFVELDLSEAAHTLESPLS